jgi:hypothetical protein
MKSVKLREINWSWEKNAFGHAVKHRASDLFLALVVQNMEIPAGAILKKAVFEVQLEGAEKPRTFSVWPPKTASFGRGEEAALIQQWLRRQGFILLGKKASDDKTDRSLAGA